MRRGSETASVFIVLWTEMGEPQVYNAANLFNANQLLLLCPIECPQEFLPAIMPFLLWRTVGWRVYVELFPHDFLINHAHHRSVRRDGQLDAMLSQKQPPIRA
jgi:hypothetical protein